MHGRLRRLRVKKASFVRFLYAGGMRFLAFLLLSASLSAQSYDVLIRDGRILDGAGNPWYRGAIAINGDTIAAMGPLKGATAKRVIDAAGRIAAPGFIDVHNHSNRSLIEEPHAENFIRQGVTTIIEGNDGGSPLPLQGFFDKVAGTGVALNYGSFLGHGSVRREVIGLVDRKATPDELDQMRRLVRQGMEQGALGLSTGFFYLPGAFAPTEEVIELAKVVAEYGGMHISHMRDEAQGLLDSVNETIRIGEEGGIPTQSTHHKAMGKRNWGRTEDSIRLVEEARRRGVDVSLDQYPYTASHTGTAALFPKWAQEGGRERLLERLGDPATRVKVRDEVATNIEFDRGGGDAKNVQFAICDFDLGYNGKTLADATREAGRDASSFAEAAETLLEIQEKGGCRAIYHAMDEGDVERVMAYAGTMIASDGAVLPFGEGVPHPRNYGTFPRVLGVYVREKGLLRLEDAVRKMTSLPAGRIGFFDRGLLRPGMKADITIFDPDEVRDTSKFGDAHHYSEGISHVIVNGAVVLDEGRMTAARPGRVLLGPGARDR